MLIDRGLAEAAVSEEGGASEGVLGPVPHSLRGFLGTHQLLAPASTAFQQCPACCNKVPHKIILSSCFLFELTEPELLLISFNCHFIICSIYLQYIYSSLWELPQEEQPWQKTLLISLFKQSLLTWSNLPLPLSIVYSYTVFSLASGLHLAPVHSTLFPNTFVNSPSQFCPRVQITSVLKIITHSVTCRYFQWFYDCSCNKCLNLQVISAYREEGFEFLLKVFNSTTYLEEVSGLSSLQQCVDDSQVMLI